MGTVKKKGCWLQCTHCGRIYHTEENVPSDKLYVNSYCAKCGHTRALNCGEDKSEIYHYYDPVLDERYY